MVNRWKNFLIDDLKRGMFETGLIIGKIKSSADKILDTGHAPEARKPEAGLDDEIKDHLTERSLSLIDKKLSKSDHEKISKQLFELLRCSLASERTPDEIFEGLRDDAEMRSEVVEMLINEASASLSKKKQRALLDGIFSGDEELRTMLKRHAAKQGV